MMERRTVKVQVFKWENWDDAWPTNLSDFIAWLNEIEQNIPQYHRDTATIEINSGMDYDSSVATVSISYMRPETDQEFSHRVAMEERARRFREEQEREMLTVLREKYPDPPK